MSDIKSRITGWVIDKIDNPETKKKVVDKWNLTLPSGNIMKGLNSLKDCSILIIEKYQKAQLQNRPFYLYDHNIRCEFRDYRIFTEYLVMEDGEIIDMTDKSE